MNRIKISQLHLGDEISHDGKWCRVVRIFAPLPPAKGPLRRGIRLREVDGDHDMHDVTLRLDDVVECRVKDAGFDLVEALVVIVIAVVLALIVTIAVAGMMHSGPSKEEHCRDRGGQVREDRYGNYDGCILPREAG